MKFKQVLKSSLMLLSIVIAGSSFAKTYNVNSSFKNDNINTIFEQLEPGDEVLFDSGNYKNLPELKITASGNESNPIILKAIDPGTVKFNGQFSWFKIL